MRLVSDTFSGQLVFALSEIPADNRAALTHVACRLQVDRDKASQIKDIAKAVKLAKEYLEK